MARTLFGAPYDLESSVGSELPEASELRLRPGVQFFPADDWTIAVDPTDGAWVALERSEHDALRTRPDSLDPKLGRLMLETGLATVSGHAKERLRPSRFVQELYFFELVVTTNCNLRCAYCFADAGAGAGSTITPSMARLFVDRVAEHRARTRSIVPYVIEFTGGEPLAAFDAIRLTVEYATDTYGDLLAVDFVVQSNLTRLTDEMVQWAADHHVSIGASCDGFAAIHDAQRPLASGSGSHRLVEESLRRLAGGHRRNGGSVIAVVTSKGVRHVPEILLHLASLGAREVSMRPLVHAGRATSATTVAPPDPREYVDGLFDALEAVITPLHRDHGILVRERTLTTTFENLLSPHRTFMCERSPCGGARNICAVTPNGDVFPCNQSAGEAPWLLGNIQTRTFAELMLTRPAAQLASRTTAAIDECRDCAFRSWCGSPCPHSVYVKTGSIHSKSVECDLHRYRYQRAFQALLRGAVDLEVVSRLLHCERPIEWRRV